MEILKLFSELFTHNFNLWVTSSLYIFALYYLLKKSPTQKNELSYKLFVFGVGTLLFYNIGIAFFTIRNKFFIESGYGVFGLLKEFPFHLIVPSLFGNIFTFLSIYGIIALYLEKNTQANYNLGLPKMFLLILGSLGSYLPIWLMQKHKEYQIDKKYHWQIVVHAAITALYYNIVTKKYQFSDWEEIKYFLLYWEYTIVLIYVVWTIYLLFSLQKQIETKSKTIKFRHWLYTLSFGFFYIQYHINDEKKFLKNIRPPKNELD